MQRGSVSVSFRDLRVEEVIEAAAAAGLRHIEWKQYLAELPGEHMLLQEFMPDDAVDSLPAEAEALLALAKSTEV